MNLWNPQLFMQMHYSEKTRIITAFIILFFHLDEFKGHSLLQAAREADIAKVKKTLALEVIGFKHPQTNETALVRRSSYTITFFCQRTAKKFNGVVLL